MDANQYFKNLYVPTGLVDVVLDTDTFNEVDDQFALSYLLASHNKLQLQAVYAAPFFNDNSTSPADGMEKSYEEIMRILKLANYSEIIPMTFRGSTQYLENEKTPVISDAAQDLVKRAMAYSPERPLYVIAIGAITNIASALLIKPEISENIVIVWLGGHAHHYHDTHEFNMYQDVAAARVVFDSGAPLIQLPCEGVVSSFTISYAELTNLLAGKNKLCDFLIGRVRDALGDTAETKPRTRVIWDVTAVAWLLNDQERFMNAMLIHSPIPEYDFRYAFDSGRHMIQYVYNIKRDALAEDLFEKLANEERFL